MTATNNPNKRAGDNGEILTGDKRDVSSLDGFDQIGWLVGCHMASEQPPSEHKTKMEEGWECGAKHRETRNRGKTHSYAWPQSRHGTVTFSLQVCLCLNIARNYPVQTHARSHNSDTRQSVARTHPPVSELGLLFPDSQLLLEPLQLSQRCHRANPQSHAIETRRKPKQCSAKSKTAVAYRTLTLLITEAVPSAPRRWLNSAASFSRSITACVCPDSKRISIARTRESTCEPDASVIAEAQSSERR